MCSHGNTTTHDGAEEAHKGVHTVEWRQCKRHTESGERGRHQGAPEASVAGLADSSFVRTHRPQEALFHIQLKSKTQRTDLVMDREAWRAAVHGVAKRHD